MTQWTAAQKFQAAATGAICRRQASASQSSHLFNFYQIALVRLLPFAVKAHHIREASLIDASRRRRQSLRLIVWDLSSIEFGS